MESAKQAITDDASIDLNVSETQHNNARQMPVAMPTQ
jgi:hypothetical protein